MKKRWCEPCGNPIVCCTCPNLDVEVSLEDEKPKKDKSADKKEKKNVLTLKLF